MDKTNEQALELLQERLTHRFRNRELLERALTHPSLLQDHPEITESNQRLEFLGDAVLQFVLTQELFARFPDEREGQLSKRRSVLTRGTFLSGLARRIGIPGALRLGMSEETTGGREKAAALEDAFEALMGALYLDSDAATARTIILSLFGDLGASMPSAEADSYAAHENPKGLLQERIQPQHGNGALHYEILAVTGEDHNRQYEVAVLLRGERLGSGTGSSKKTAETAAARVALAELDRRAAPAS